MVRSVCERLSLPDPTRRRSAPPSGDEWFVSRSFCDDGEAHGISWYIRASAPATTADACDVPLPTTNDDPIFEAAGATVATTEPEASRLCTERPGATMSGWRSSRLMAPDENEAGPSSVAATVPLVSRAPTATT